MNEKYVIVDEYGEVIHNKIFRTKKCAEEYLRQRARLGKNDNGLKIKQIFYPLLPTNCKD